MKNKLLLVVLALALAGAAYFTYKQNQTEPVQWTLVQSL